MTTAANLLAFRQLNQALRDRGHRAFAYSKLLALCAAGHIPTYTSALRTCRGVPTRLFDPDEVIAVIESSIRPAANQYYAHAPIRKKKTKNAYRTSIGTDASKEAGQKVAPTADVLFIAEDGKCDHSWEEAMRLLSGAGVTAGQEEGILRRMHPSLKSLPPGIAVRAAILEMGGAPRSGGWLRKALLEGYPRILVRAKSLQAKHSTTPAQLAEHQTDARSEELSRTVNFAEPAKPLARHVASPGQSPNHDPAALLIWWPILTEMIPGLIPDESIRTWLAPLTAEAWDGQVLHLRADSDIACQWITQQLEEELKSTGIAMRFLPPAVSPQAQGGD